MTTFTLELPDSLAKKLRTLPKAEVNAFAVETFPELVEAKRDLPTFPTPLSRADLTEEEIAAIEEGLAELADGKGIDGKTFFANLDAYFDQLDATTHLTKNGKAK